MMAGFHSGMPVTGCLIAEAISLKCRGKRVFPDWTLPVVAVFGMLPDICSPHLSLEARYESWSHTLLFLVGLIPVCAGIASFFERGKRLRVAVVIWSAAMLHLAADAVSGGIPWLLPWRRNPLGDYYIEPPEWIWYDIFFVVTVWLGWRLRQHLELRALEKEPSS